MSAGRGGVRNIFEMRIAGIWLLCVRVEDVVRSSLGGTSTLVFAWWNPDAR